MDGDETEKDSKSALRGSELPISGGIQTEVADGPLGGTLRRRASASTQSPSSSCANLGTVALHRTDEALPSGLTGQQGSWPRPRTSNGSLFTAHRPASQGRGRTRTRSAPSHAAGGAVTSLPLTRAPWPHRIPQAPAWFHWQ